MAPAGGRWLITFTGFSPLGSGLFQGENDFKICGRLAFQLPPYGTPVKASLSANPAHPEGWGVISNAFFILFCQVQIVFPRKRDCLGRGRVFPHEARASAEARSCRSSPSGAGLSRVGTGSTAPGEGRRALSPPAVGPGWHALSLDKPASSRCYGDDSADPPQVSERMKCANTNRGPRTPGAA